MPALSAASASASQRSRGPAHSDTTWAGQRINIMIMKYLQGDRRFDSIGCLSMQHCVHCYSHMIGCPGTWTRSDSSIGVLVQLRQVWCCRLQGCLLVLLAVCPGGSGVMVASQGAQWMCLSTSAGWWDMQTCSTPATSESPPHADSHTQGTTLCVPKDVLLL